MSETYQFKLPLISPSQAQKHVTVNEALVRIDALGRLRFGSRILSVPPSLVAEGRCFVVGNGATGAWVGKDGQVAIRSNGGWNFAQPLEGWQAWDESLSSFATFDGNGWLDNAAAISSIGAATLSYIRSIDHEVGAGTSSTTPILIPSHAQVLAVTARVISSVTGAGLTSFSIGVAADLGRYGSGLGLALNSFARGITGTAVTYYSDTALILTPNAGTFGGGTIRFAVHLCEVVPPGAV